MRISDWSSDVCSSGLLAPSLLPAISLVYLFGNQGLVREALLGHSVYGPIGIVMGEVFYTFPHAFIVIATALSLADARPYEAAESLGSGRLRTFFAESGRASCRDEGCQDV